MNKVYAILLLAFTHYNISAQVSCKDAIDFSTGFTANIYKKYKGFKSVRESSLTEDDAKVLKKIEKSLRKVDNNIKFNRITVSKARLEESEAQYRVKYEVKFEDYTYRFMIYANKRGKIIGDIPLESMKKQILMPVCKAFFSGEASVDVKTAVGILLDYVNGEMVWVIYHLPKGVKSSEYNVDIARTKRSEHEVLILDAFNGSIFGRAERLHYEVE